ncbi:cupin domain-containing protein [Streptomyces sp. NBC_01171]|uniref:cupin domain-containing protein n=1 Tax=Streptomyces sp. NBC_01171 TaxID=2903757 RepID=UPI00386CEA94|nr:cupin domain-containing protein [Streptomyces sp. NBC_01171]
MDTSTTPQGFEDLVGDRQVFFQEYFNRKPLLRRGALDGRTRDLVSVRQLDDIVALETVSPAYLRIAKDGRGVPGKAYTRTVTDRGAALAEAVVAEQVYELFRSGGTVTWNALNHFLPAARHLADLFARTFACPCEVVAFLTPAGKDGYAPHHDPVDVYVIQIEGTKDWRIWEPPAGRRADKASHRPEDLGPPAIETTLRAGDILYLPYGTPHAAAAKDQVSLHLSVTVEPRRWRDLLAETVQHLLEDPDFDGFPHLADPTHPGTAATLKTLSARLADLLAGADAAAETDRLRETGRARAGAGRPREFERLASADVLAPAALLRRSPVPLEIGPSDGAKSALLVNGHRLNVPDAVADALRGLQDGRAVTAARFFPGVDEARSVHVAQGLTRLGVLETADRTRS